MKKNIGYLVVTGIIILSAIGYGIYNRLNTEKKEEVVGNKDKEKPTAVVRVETITATRRNLIMSINTTGTAKAVREVNIGPKISGEVEEVLVHEGAYVREKNPVLRLDNEDYLLSLQQSENELTTAKINYGVRKKQEDKDFGRFESPQQGGGELNGVARKMQVLEKKYQAGQLSKDSYEDSMLELEVEELFLAGNKDKILKNSSGLSKALINYKKAKINFDNTVVEAPFSGYIAGLDAVRGQNISSGHVAARLVDLSEIKMEIPVLESEVGQLVQNRKVKVTFNAYPAKIFSGRIKYISPVVDQQTKTCKVIVNLKNPGNLIKPGMNGDVTIDGRIYDDRLLVPKEAIIVRDNRKLLFIVQEGKAKWLYVQTGLENFDYVEVLTKLEEGMEVIVTNNYTLAHDANVKIVKKKG